MRIEDIVDVLDKRLPAKTREAGIRFIFHKQVLPSSFGAYKIYIYRLFYVDAYNRRRFPLIVVQSCDKNSDGKEEDYTPKEITEMFLNGIFDLIEDTTKWESIVRGEYGGSGGEEI